MNLQANSKIDKVSLRPRTIMLIKDFTIGHEIEKKVISNRGPYRKITQEKY